MRPELMLKAVRARGAKSVFLKLLRELGEPLHRDAVLAAHRDDDRLGTADAQAHLAADRAHPALVPAPLRGDDRRLDPRPSSTSAARSAASRATSASTRWTMTDLAFLAHDRQEADRGARRCPLQVLIGLLISNGPGTISAQGAKGAVSADGPETPERVQINKAMVGFLTHTGYSHGGNGFEGMAFLLEQFKDKDLDDPTDPNHGLDLKAMATAFARAYRREKAERREHGRRRATGAARRAPPGVQGQAGQPRSARALHRRAHGRSAASTTCSTTSTAQLVQALYDEGVVALRVLRQRRRRDRRAAARRCSGRTIGAARSASAISRPRPSPSSCYGRMIGCAAEIDDHLNRGRNMDTRTPAPQCSFVT